MTYAIKVHSVNKSFKLPHERTTSVKGLFLNAFSSPSFERQHVLKDVSFEIKKGEFFGIVGRNGSGKSTMLKLLAGIYEPDSGSIQIDGRLTPFIELGVGFNPELTGRENVFLNGALLGFNRTEMGAMYDEIVQFAELERFMDQKLKNYSSGMQVRLAFSIAIRAKSDILLIDEVLAVGDANFQRKCFTYFKQLKRDKRTVVFVSHDMSSVEEFCDSAVLIDSGKVVVYGSTGDVVRSYSRLNTETLGSSKSHVKQEIQTSQSPVASIVKAWTENNNSTNNVFEPGNKIEVCFQVVFKRDVANPVTGITIYDQAGKPLFASNTKALKLRTGVYKEGDILTTRARIDNIFSDGTYLVVPAVASSDTHIVYDTLEEPLQFEVSGWRYPAYLLQPEHVIQIEKSENK